MFGIPSPYLLLGAAVAAVFVYFTGHHKGWVERDQEMQAEIAAKNEAARKTEIKLNEQISATASQLLEANNVIDQKQSALTTAIRAGRVRLPAPSCVQTPASATPAAPNPEDGAESDRQTLLLIAQLAADGDKAINQLNACITAYEQVREQINGQR